jgi:hypothetical protein
MTGKARCRVHGGASTGATSLEGKERQAEGRRLYLRKLRGQQGGPATATLPGAPVSLSDAAVSASAGFPADPVERMRLHALASLPPQGDSLGVKNDRLAHPHRVADAPAAPLEQPAAPEWVTIQDGNGNPITVKVTPPDPETCRRILDELFPDGVVPALQPQAAKPALAAANPTPTPDAGAGALPPVIVEDASLLAREVEEIAQAAIARIKELLKNPFDRTDPNFAALIRFLSSTYNTSMTTIARTDDTRLKRQAVSRLDTILARVAEERLKRDARRTVEGETATELHDTRTVEETPHGDAS